MTIIQQKLKGVLAAVYPIICVFTGLTIATVGMCTIAYWSEFIRDIAWTHYVAFAVIVIATTWWTFYFLYKGMATLRAPTRAKGKK